MRGDNVRIISACVKGFQAEGVQLNKLIKKSKDLARNELWNAKRRLGTTARSYQLVYGFLRYKSADKIETKPHVRPNYSEIGELLYKNCGFSDQKLFRDKRHSSVLDLRLQATDVAIILSATPHDEYRKNYIIKSLLEAEIQRQSSVSFMKKIKSFFTDEPRTVETTIKELALIKRRFHKDFKSCPIAYLLDLELSKNAVYNELIENVDIKKLW
jgi:hypothetical protein